MDEGNGTSPSDTFLIDRIRCGEQQALEVLISRYQEKVYNLALRFTSNPEDAEEVLQDVFSTIFRKVSGFQGKSAFSSWLYRVVANASFMKLRKRRRSPTVSIEDLSPGTRKLCLELKDADSSRSDSLSNKRELRDVLQRAVDRLPKQYRMVFILRDVDGLSNQEVGDLLGISVPAVKSRLHRSRLLLRKKLKGYYAEYSGTVGADGAPDQLSLGCAAC